MVKHRELISVIHQIQEVLPQGSILSSKLYLPRTFEFPSHWQQFNLKHTTLNWLHQDFKEF